MPQVKVCLSPLLYEAYKLENSLVVVIDIFRATSTFCVAFSEGVKTIHTFAKAADALAYKNKENFVTAGERNGERLDDFELSNSPFDFINNEAIKGKDLAFTTTNGTQAIALAQGSGGIVIGSYLNMSTLISWLAVQQKNVVFLCAGWKNTINIEDSLFAGDAAHLLLKDPRFTSDCDGCFIAQKMAKEARKDRLGYIYQMSPRVASRKVLEKDFQYCLQEDVLEVLPVLEGECLVNLYE